MSDRSGNGGATHGCDLDITYDIQIASVCAPRMSEKPNSFFFVIFNVYRIYLLKFVSDRSGNGGATHGCDLDIIGNIQIASVCAPECQRKLTLFFFVVFNVYRIYLLKFVSDRSGNGGATHGCDLDIISNIQIASVCCPECQRKLTLFSLSYLMFNVFIFSNLFMTDVLPRMSEKTNSFFFVVFNG